MQYLSTDLLFARCDLKFIIIFVIVNDNNIIISSSRIIIITLCCVSNILLLKMFMTSPYKISDACLHWMVNDQYQSENYRQFVAAILLYCTLQKCYLNKNLFVCICQGSKQNGANVTYISEVLLKIIVIFP
jgi:hypothetical protein